MDRGVTTGPRPGSSGRQWVTGLHPRHAATLVNVVDQPEPASRAGRAGRRRWSAWRVGTLVVALLSGGLFVVSAQSSEGTDLRPGRYDDLAALTDSEADRAAGLQERVAELTAGGRASSPTRSTTTRCSRYQAAGRRSSRTRPG